MATRMKKPWEVVVQDGIEPEVKKKLKRLLQPVPSVRGPEKCLFCGTMTTWRINNKPVCPACSVKYGFDKADRIPDPCEVCGRQGEWCTEGDPVHSLCYVHRDEWFHWSNPKLNHIDHKKQPEKWHQVWEEGWAEFVAFMKERDA
jgi:hypothetical protein